MPKRLFPVLVLAAIILASSLPHASASLAPPSGTEAPLLWAGRVVDHLGAPSSAQVTAFLRPPASAIPTAGSGQAAPPSILLAFAATGRDGRFALRADAPPIPEEYRPDGWLQVMVLAVASNGSWSLANDSMRYVAAAGPLRRGTWVSTVSAEDEVRAILNSGRAPTPGVLDRLVSEDLTGGVERPAVLQLNQPRFTASGAGPASGRWVGPDKPYVGCHAVAIESREETFRTISDIDVGPAWSHILHYTDTKTTSWDIGVEQDGGGWKAGGTTSFSNTLSGGFDAEYGPYPSRFREEYQVNLVHAKVLWRCGGRMSPGPFYIRTVEAETWAGGTFNQGEPIIPCNPDHREPIAGHTKGWRADGKTSKYSASAAGFGFRGGAAITYTKNIRLGWHNHLGHARDVCGESANPFKGRTRVAAMDEHR